MHRTLRRVCACTVSAVVCSGLALGVADTAFAKTKSHHRAHAKARYLRAARNALDTYLRRTAVPLDDVVGVHGATETSGNWSGYVTTSTTAGAFTRVSGTWAVPSVTCTAEDQIASMWVGIDGQGTSTVEQDGTLQWCFKGTATYYTWYEMFPAGTIAVGNTVKPHDKISAVVSRAGTNYTLTVTDSTTPANSFTHTATCAAATCLDESAEWVAERPAFSIGVAPLAKYHKWTLNGGMATRSGTAGAISTLSPIQINMIDATGSYDLSDASALTATGKGFSTTWLNSW